MAEPVSSIVTLTTVSLAIISQTIEFIQEADAIDSLIEDLLDRLLELKKLIKVVEETCEKPRPFEDDPSRFVRDSIAKCRLRIQIVYETTLQLASHPMNSLPWKMLLKVRSKRTRTEIDKAIQDVDRIMDQIHKGISCWNLHMTSVIERRTSEAPPVQQKTPPFAKKNEDAVFGRTSSESRSTLANDRATSSRRASSTTQCSGTSISPTRIPGSTTTRTDSMTAHTELDKERIDFHHKITKCGGHKDRIKVIKAVLKHYPWLVNSTDGMERTPLHLAAKRGDVILGEVLFQCGADLNAKDLNGNSVLQFAIEQNEEDFVIFLLDNNVKVDKRTMSKEIRYRLEEIQSLAEL